MIEAATTGQHTAEDDAKFISWLEEHEHWYEFHSRWWGSLRICCRILTLVASIASIIVAAAIDKFETTGKWLIVATSTLAIVSNELLTQLKVVEMEELREDGHLEASEIVAYARHKFHEFAQDLAQRNKIKDDLLKRIAELEHSQSRGHASIETSRKVTERPEQRGNG
jgi:hypothetical protein